MPCIGVIIDTHLLVTVSTLATEEDLLQLRKACSTLSLAARCSSLTPALLQHSTRWTLPEQQCQLTQTLLLLLQAGEAAARGCAGLRVRRCRRRSGSVSRSCCAAPSAAPARPASTPMAAPRCRRQRRALARRAPHRRRLSCVTRSLGVAPGRGFLHPCFRDSAGAGQLARCLLPATATLATHGRVLRALLDCGIAHVWFALSIPSGTSLEFHDLSRWVVGCVQPFSVPSRSMVLACTSTSTCIIFAAADTSVGLHMQRVSLIHGCLAQRRLLAGRLFKLAVDDIR